MNTNMRSILFVAALACAATGASAQTIYKVVDGEGHMTFSDVPPPKPAALPRRGAKIEVNEAARRLKRAQLDRRQGTEPRSGELNNSNGARTVNYRYWQRQEKLRVAVEMAQRRSSETLGFVVAAR